MAEPVVFNNDFFASQDDADSPTANGQGTTDEGFVKFDDDDEGFVDEAMFGGSSDPSDSGAAGSGLSGAAAQFEDGSPADDDGAVAAGGGGAAVANAGGNNGSSNKQQGKQQKQNEKKGGSHSKGDSAVSTMSSVPASVSDAEPFVPGIIFGCTSETRDECLSRCLFGLPKSYLSLVLSARPRSTVLFLYNFTDKHLYGVFQATGPGGLDLQPSAWSTTASGPGSGGGNGGGGKARHPFPAQLPFEELFNFLPVPEKRFKHILNTNTKITSLTAHQVVEIIKVYGQYEAEIATAASDKIVTHFSNNCRAHGVDTSPGAEVGVSAPQPSDRKGQRKNGGGGGGGGGGGQQQQQQQQQQGGEAGAGGGRKRRGGGRNKKAGAGSGAQHD